VKTSASLVKPGIWQRMRTGSATKGAKDYHWAMIEITPDDIPEGHDAGHAVLLLRRHRYTGTVSSFLCWTPNPVPLAKLIQVAVTRWRIEMRIRRPALPPAGPYPVLPQAQTHAPPTSHPTTMPQASIRARSQLPGGRDDRL
jgi:hypothetical protein